MSAGIDSHIPEVVQLLLAKSVSAGQSLSAEDIVKASRQAGYPGVTLQEAARWRRYFAHLQRLSSAKRTPKKFATALLPHYGLVFVDAGFCYRRWAGYNNGVWSFVVGVEAATQQLALAPLRSKKSVHWRQALEAIVTESVFGRVNTLVSDQEPSIVSRTFRDKLRDELGVNCIFLTKGSKAYLAETFIRHVKSSLAAAVEQRKSDGDKNYRQWVRLLPSVARSFNGRFANGTSYKRRDIDEKNFGDYLRQLLGVKDPTLLVHTGSIPAGKLFPPRWVKRIFKLALGQHVLVNKAAVRSSDKGVFDKSSLQGAWLPYVYRVERQLLKRSKDGLLVPVYRVANAEDGVLEKGFFYAEELLKVNAPAKQE